MFLHIKIKEKSSQRIILFLFLIFLIFFINLSFSLRANIIDTDSGFEYTNAQNILINNKIEHGPVLQQFFYALILSVFGYEYRNILIIQSVLSTLIILITFQFIRRKIEFTTSLLSIITFMLFPVFYYMNYSLKQYPLFLFLLIFSIYYFSKYLDIKKHSLLFLSALFMGLSVMTHLLCLPFVGLVILYYLLSKLRKKNNLTFRETLYFYILLLLILSSYILWRVSVDGMSLDLLLTYPSTWGTIKYGRTINIEFWKHAAPFTLEYYYSFLQLLKDFAFLPVLMPFIFLGYIRCKNKVLLASWFFILITPYLIGRGVLGGIYSYPFIPLVVILTVKGLSEFFRLKNFKKLRSFVIFGLICLSFISLDHSIVVFDLRMGSTTPAVSDIEEFSKNIPKNSNVLFRSRAISPLLPCRNILVITKDLSEEEAATYLGWTSDNEVSDIFKKHNISYVILYKDIRWEKDYHVWFKIKTGEDPKHYLMIQKSPYFREVADGRCFTLYEFLKS